GTHLSAVVDTVDPRWRGRYSALVPGALEYLASVGPCQLVRTREVLAMVGGLPVKINPQFGLAYPDGRKEAVRLHLDEVPPHPAGGSLGAPGPARRGAVRELCERKVGNPGDQAIDP